MKPSDLIRVIEEANRLLRIYGQALNLKQDKGLLTDFALSLTVVPVRDRKRIAARLSIRRNHGWSNVNDKDRATYQEAIFPSICPSTARELSR